MPKTDSSSDSDSDRDTKKSIKKSSAKSGANTNNKRKRKEEDSDDEEVKVTKANDSDSESDSESESESEESASDVSESESEAEAEENKEGEEVKLDADGKPIKKKKKSKRVPRSKFTYENAIHAKANKVIKYLKKRKRDEERRLGEKARKYKLAGKTFNKPRIMPRFFKTAQFKKAFLAKFKAVHRLKNPRKLKRLPTYIPLKDENGDVIFRTDKKGKIMVKDGVQLPKYEKDAKGNYLKLRDKKTKELILRDRNENDKFKDRMEDDAAAFLAVKCENDIINITRNAKENSAAETANPELITPIRWGRSAVQFHKDSGIPAGKCNLGYRMVQQIEDSCEKSKTSYWAKTKKTHDDGLKHAKFKQSEYEKYDIDRKHKIANIVKLLTPVFGSDQHSMVPLNERRKIDELKQQKKLKTQTRAIEKAKELEAAKKKASK
jgi:hypothetical protein